MRIGCLQFAPQVGDVDNNLNRADSVLNKAHDVEDLDLLVLPELAFTGYNFHSLAHIAPYLEPSGSGISSLWARTTALKLNCNVAVGYPEKVDVAESWPTSPEYYNSVIVVNRDGETIANYRKSFLYSNDETWALEGRDGFFEEDIPDLGYVAMGICMDINPYKFEAPWHAFEFAFHILEVQANVVILSMAWLTREDPRTFTRLPQEPDLETLKYWVQRLEPVIRSENEEEIIVIICNRTGMEENCVYAGTSTILGIQSGEVSVYGVLGRGVKELLVVDTDKRPYAKLVTGDGPEVAADEEQEHVPAQSSPREMDNPNNPIPSDCASSKISGNGYHDGHQMRREGNPVRNAPSIAPNAKHPKLGLKIPATTDDPGQNQKWQSPMSGAVSGGEAELPTPTAPSPTPNCLRPRIDFPDTRSPLSQRLTKSSLEETGDSRYAGYISALSPSIATRDWIMKNAIVPNFPSASQLPPSPPADVLTSGQAAKKPSPTDEGAAPVSSGPEHGAQAAAGDKSRSTMAASDASVTVPTQPQTTAYTEQDVQVPLGLSFNDGRVSTVSVPARPLSTKSRNASHSRAASAIIITDQQRASQCQSRMSIPMIASPSIFNTEQRAALSKMGSLFQRPDSDPEIGKHAGNVQVSEPRGPRSHSADPLLRNADGRSHVPATERPISRGRQPFSKNVVSSIASSAQAPQSTARNAIFNLGRGRRPSGGFPPASARATSAASSSTWLFGTPPPQAQSRIDPDDEIVAMINLISDSCPLHNQTTPPGPSPPAGTEAPNQQTGHNGGQVNQTTGAARTAGVGTPETTRHLPEGHQVTDGHGNIYELVLPPNLLELVETLSDRRMGSPLRALDLAQASTCKKFNPPTPTAMTYSISDSMQEKASAPTELKQRC